jgi:hypothetical protein
MIYNAHALYPISFMSLCSAWRDLRKASSTTRKAKRVQDTSELQITAYAQGIAGYSVGVKQKPTTGDT